MNSINKILPVFVIIILISWSGLYAQSWDQDDRKERSRKSNWFMDWIFDKQDNRDWDHPSNDDIYNGVALKIDLTKRWFFSIGDNKAWSQSNINDENWEKIRVPYDWENDGFNGYDGYAWYRVHFDGKKLNKNNTHFLILGFIDDVDETFINGNLVGRSGHFPPRFRTAYNSNRRYYIPNENINFEGDNIIAVRVFDQHLNGGIVKGKPGIYTSDKNEELLQSLYGSWKFRKLTNRAYSRTDYDDSKWENLLVPSTWDNQGYRSFDGTAWYRKNFDLSFTPEKNKTYYLILGKIDDFDITFLNGIKIGETQDDENYGQSESYNKIRVYRIPQGLLNADGNNVIAVKVHDIGLDGGIYKGPIGIVEEADVTRVIRRSY